MGNLNLDKYISYNEYKEFCNNFNIECSEEILNDMNSKFVENKLIEYKEYFDHIFIDAGENINLDDEQRKIVLRDDEYCLINAGAGSGKSTTMAAKVKYLVDKLHIKPEEIIMLTFTKKSSEDLDEKVNNLLDLGIPVSTFHSLGMKFIRKVYPYKVQVVGDDEQKTIISEYIKELFKDKNKLKKLIYLFRQYENKNFIAKGFVDNFENFDTFEEYFADYKKRKYLLENSKSGGIHTYLINRLNSEKMLYTIKGEKVKSIAEVRIANFLYTNSIDYSYEKVFEEYVNQDVSYKPDFTIEYHGRTIYIEYFGLSSCYDEKNVLNQKELLKYNRFRKLKEKYQSSHDYDFINLDYLNPDGDYLTTLEKELINRNVEFVKKSDEEIFDRMLDNNLNSEFFKFTDLVIDFINVFKNMLVDNDDYMFEKRKNEIKEENFKYVCYSVNRDEEIVHRTEALDYLKDIYNFYQKYLAENRLIDYSDMINLSYKEIIKDVKNKYPELNYKYIVVDEYQDITFQRFLFIKRLVEYFNAKLIAVGDDWQSIYAFAGSRLDLFNRFSEMFSNSKDDMCLSTTYRYGQELVDITSTFILENDEQSKKEIKSIKHLKTPIEFWKYEDFQEDVQINNIIHKLYAENPNYNILILARTNSCLVSLFNSPLFRKGINDVLICKDLPEAKIEALTMHRSKGLTADQVIVFGLRNKCFPSKGHPYHWIFNYFRLDTISDGLFMDNMSFEKSVEKIPYAEERRLFYVALTRTRNKVYLLVPNNANSESEFVKELRRILEKNQKTNNC